MILTRVLSGLGVALAVTALGSTSARAAHAGGSRDRRPPGPMNKDTRRQGNFAHADAPAPL